MLHLPDGSYDVIVVDTETLEDGDVRIEVTITLGPHVGEIVALRARHVENRRADVSVDHPSDLLGVCGTLRVREGVPFFRPEIA